MSFNNSSYYEYVRREILPLLPNKINRVLEIGCGSGNTLEWLSSIRKCQWAGGVEINSAAAKEARKKINEVFEGNIETMDLPVETYSLDLILCLDVLEHLIDPWSVVEKLKSFLKEDGALIASIPNVRHKSVLFPLIFQERWDYTTEGLLDKTHLRFFVRQSAIDLFTQAGYTVDMISETGLGRSRKSKIVNKMLPAIIRSLFEKQYLIRALKISRPSNTFLRIEDQS